MIVKFADKEYTVKYGIEATSKSKIFTKIVKLEDSMVNGKMEFDDIDSLALIIAEALLVGLQCRENNGEFKYDYDTSEGKDEQLSKACALLDDYDGDIFDLYAELSNEMTKNGFLRSLFEKIKKSAEEQTEDEKPKKKKKLEVVAEN